MLRHYDRSLCDPDGHFLSFNQVSWNTLEQFTIYYISRWTNWSREQKKSQYSRVAFLKINRGFLMKKYKLAYFKLFFFLILILKRQFWHWNILNNTKIYFLFKGNHNLIKFYIVIGTNEKIIIKLFYLFKFTFKVSSNFITVSVKLR